MIIFSKCNFQFNYVISNKMQSFHTYININDTNPKDQMPKMQNVYFFCIFNIKNEKASTKQQLEINTLLYANRYKPSRISKSKHPTLYARTTNENDDEKEKPLENSTKERFPITLQALNSHDRDLIRLINH
jgi:hypothetical protein